MTRTCLRHELRMLRLTAATVRGATDRGLHSPEHAALLVEIEHCDRCRRRREAPVELVPEAPEETAPAHVIVTFTLPEEVVDAEELAATLEEALPDHAAELTVRVA